jgi:hypothetical protein
VRAALLTPLLVLVLLASALNLALGALWVAALAGVTVVRRRVPYGAWLVLALAVAGAVGAARLGWLAPPPLASYGADEATWLHQRLARLGLPGQPAGPADSTGFAGAAAALRARLQALRRAEFRYTGRQLEQRAVAAIAVSRDVGRLRARAPAEVTALEEAVRQLALTLTAPEFRDLEAREARLAGWLDDLDARLAAARDESDLDAVRRALEPAALAGVSLRALREDLSRVDQASVALVRVVTGGSGIQASASSRLELDEPRRLVVEERRFVFEATPPLRLTRLDVGALRGESAAPGADLTGQSIAAGVDGEEPRPLTGGEVAPRGGATRIVLVERRERPAAGDRVTARLRPIRFTRLVLGGDAALPSDFPVRVLLGDGGGPEPLLIVDPGPVRLASLTAPRSALHHVSRPGTITPASDGDVWVPAGPEAAGAVPVLVVELRPAFLRNPVHTRLRAYLYAPNLAGGIVILALAALTSIVLRPRPRRAAPPTPSLGGVPTPPR